MPGQVCLALWRSAAVHPIWRHFMHNADQEFLVRIPNFEKYVDENFDPLMDDTGKELFESNVIDKLENEQHKKLMRIFFAGAIASAKEQAASGV